MQQTDLLKLIEARISASLQNFVGRPMNQKMQEEMASSLSKSIGEVRSVPAYVIKQTKDGPVLVLGPDLLLGKTARDLREFSLVLPASVPDCAEVKLDSSGMLVFEWYEISAILNGK